MAVRFVSVGREPLSLRKEDGCICAGRGSLLYLDQLFAVGVQDAGFGDEAHVAVLFVHDGQHPRMFVLELLDDALDGFMLQNLVGRLNHVVRNRMAVFLAFEHVFAQVVQLDDAEQMPEVVDHGEDVAARRRNDVYDVAQREVLPDAQEIGLHQFVEFQEDEDRLVLVVGQQLPAQAQLLGVDRIRIEVRCV